MYSSTHSAVALSILLLPIPLASSIPAAILAHAFVDTLGEASNPNWPKQEAILLSFLLLMGLLTQHYYLVMLSIILGNLFDFIDKCCFKTFINKEPIHSFKFYPPVLLPLSLRSTIIINIFSILSASILLWRF
jgi:hypothetical protein